MAQLRRFLRPAALASAALLIGGYVAWSSGMVTFMSGTKSTMLIPPGNITPPPEQPPEPPKQTGPGQ